MRSNNQEQPPYPKYVHNPEVKNEWDVRNEFHRLMFEDLVGPKDGPEEEIFPRYENRVSNRYILGVLAPKNTRPPSEEAEEFELEDLEQQVGNESAEASEEMDDTPTMSADSMLATALGFTCCVAPGTSTLRATFRWGAYRKELSQTGYVTEKKGDPAMVYRRSQYEETFEFNLNEEFECSVHEDFPAVKFRTKPFALDDGSTLISLFVDNCQEGADARDEAWLFQTSLSLESAHKTDCFVTNYLTHQADAADPMTEQQEKHLALLYRKQVEFAVGHGTACDWELGSDFQHACRIWTTPMPSFEVKKNATVAIPDVESSMKKLGNATQGELFSMLSPLITQYSQWIGEQMKLRDAESEKISTREEIHTASVAMNNCFSALEVIQEGIHLVSNDPVAFEAFQFMNRVMHEQRIHSIYAQAKRKDANSKITLEEVEQNEKPQWRMFQLAFILSSLPSLTQLDHPERCDDPTKIKGPTAELLWFPTGGGKTEAYLGLTAYTLALRRLQGNVEGYDGGNGVAVLMRYTLRLLTIQQFQRATTLICACEAERQRDKKWGTTPFRIGLWVGSASTPNRIQDAVDIIDAERGSGYASGKGTLKQITSCPWCGCEIGIGRDVEVDRDQGKVIFYCGDGKGRCIFSRAKSKGNGVPIVVVDEQIYRYLPSLIIATVDKFAQMPWNGEIASLFGKVDRYCPRHGFLTPSADHESESHPARGGNEAVSVKTCGLLRPPDLIIQDELHLISGPLGSIMGMYEAAIDELCSWQVNGKTVRPKIILSTATIKRAHIQVEKLFARRLRTFPARGINSDDMFFARESEPAPTTPGLRYVGICVFGRRLKSTLIRVYASALCSARTLQVHYPEHSDQLQTLVGYFASLRELGGMRRLLEDSVKARCKKMDSRGLENRTRIAIEEMTSRRRASDIPVILSRLESPVPKEASERDAMKYKPIDALIATNMISVGVDVGRLGLMVVCGQPKSSSEYIQATSRVGREKAGIVLTVFNFGRARDVSHYETFKSYHAAYHRHVENPSITPFSKGSVDRAIAASLVATARLGNLELNEDKSANEATRQSPKLNHAMDVLIERAIKCSADNSEVDNVKNAAQQKHDKWLKDAMKPGIGLSYKNKQGTYVPLLHEPVGIWRSFSALNSLRGVEGTGNLVLVDDFEGENE